jgi:hypothetical protein
LFQSKLSGLGENWGAFGAMDNYFYGKKIYLAVTDYLQM